VGAFADTLKKYKKDGGGYLQNLQNPLGDFSEVQNEAPTKPTKPIKVGFDGFVGTSPGTLENIFAQNDADTKKPEEADFLGETPGSLENISTAPSIDLTHRTTVDLIFNDPETGTVRTIPGGTPCRRFSGTTGAMLAGVKLDYMGEWAANKNIERGYGLIWIEGALRGVSFSDVQPLKGATHD
jgi:hypothetical protein